MRRFQEMVLGTCQKLTVGEGKWKQGGHQFLSPLKEESGV